jgi:hypothetical protein
MTNQTWVATIAATDDKVDTLTETIPENFRLLRSSFRGTAAPNDPIAGEVWDDTTTGTRKKYDGSAWVVLGPLDMAAVLAQVLVMGTISATKTVTLAVTQDQIVVTSISIYSRAATTSDGSNLWTINLLRDTDDASMFATPPTTNGADFVAKTAKVLTPDQNQSIATAGKGLALVLTKTGSATDLTDLLVQVRGYEASP